MTRGQKSFFENLKIRSIQFSIVPAFILNFIQSVVGLTPLEAQPANKVETNMPIQTQASDNPVAEGFNIVGGQVETSSSSSAEPSNPEKLKREVFGFLPYWRLDQAPHLRYDLLSTIAYFGVDADSNGNFIQSQNGGTEPGWAGWLSPTMEEVRTKARENNVRVVLTVKAMTNDRIRAILSDPVTRMRLVNRTVDEVNSKGGRGVNIDFEYVGNPGPVLRNQFTAFVHEMTETLHRKIPGSELSVDVYAGGAREPMLYDIPAIAPTADKIFIMAYDFYRPGSPTAGPVAPLYGAKEGRYFLDVSTSVEDYLKVVPAEKIVLGVAYYGWDWSVANGKIPGSSRAWGSTEMKTYAFTQMDGANNAGTRGWDDLAKSPWYWWWDGSWRQVWYEDRASLGFKYDFINAKNLGGVGIWALGYDRERPELWSLFKEKFFG